MNDQRFDRSIRFFGRDGQQQLQQANIVFAGLGGLGSVAVQQAALLAIGNITLVDRGWLKESNRNRYVTACANDPIPGTRKVDIAKRLVQKVDPGILVTTIFDSIISKPGLEAIKEADIVVGCLDNEGSRLLLLQACAGLGTPYLDLATEIVPGEGRLDYGGRVLFSFLGNGCLSCLDELDRDEANRDLASEGERVQRWALYGVDVDLLGDSGPSVGPLNSIVASHGMFELMAHLSGLRAPETHLNYNGQTGKMAVRSGYWQENCYFCEGLLPGKIEFDTAELLECGRQLVITDKD